MVWSANTTSSISLQLHVDSHALTCPTGGYPTLHHNEIRDLTADLLQEVCHDVTMEPHLQQMTGEVISGRTSVVGDEARLDVSACGMWGGRFERTFCDIRVFNSYAPSNCSQSLGATYRKHEQEKRRQYEERIGEIKPNSRPLYIVYSLRVVA